MTPRLVYLVEWRERGRWQFRVFTSEAPALRVAGRMSDQGVLPIIAAVLPGDVRMLQHAERVA